MRSMFHLGIWGVIGTRVIAAPALPDPVIAEVSDDSSWDPAVINMCVDPNFGGQCYWVVSPNGYCSTFPWCVYDKMNAQVSSFEVDQFTTDRKSCTFYKDAGCSGTSFSGANSSDLRTTPYNDMITSWKC